MAARWSGVQSCRLAMTTMGFSSPHRRNCCLGHLQHEIHLKVSSVEIELFSEKELHQVSVASHGNVVKGSKPEFYAGGDGDQDDDQ